MLPDAFLELDDEVVCCGERGLLGLTFDPNYDSNGYFYVNYSRDSDGATVISRFSVSGNPNIANTAETPIMVIPQTDTNHNGGDIAFGPDGYLYIGMGDGGGTGDPFNDSQDLTELLGKMLRIDVHGGGGPADCVTEPANTNYTVPDDNPYENGVGGVCDEIWSSGLRNPWRWSFDSLTGEIYIGDVGQFDEEEVDVQAADGGMEDWGWDCYEGNSAYTGPSAGTGCGPMGDYDFPVFAYTSSSGTNECAITGGFVYRGSLYPAMVGHYIFADYCSGEFWSLYNSGGTWEDTHQGDLGGTVLTFGEGYDGEIYVSLGGSIYHVVEDTLSTTHTPSPTATHTATATQTPSASLTPTPTIIPTPSDFLFLALIRG